MKRFFHSRPMMAWCILCCSSCAHLDTGDSSPPIPRTAEVQAKAGRWEIPKASFGELKPASWEKGITVASGDATTAAPLTIPDAAPPATAEQPDQAPKADTPPAPSVFEELVVGEGMTLAKLEELALQNNPTLRQAGFAVQQSEGNWVQVGLYPNPVVGYQGEEINDDGTAGKQGIFATQTIVTADKLEWNRAAASWDVEQTRWQADAQRWAIVNSVRVQFYAVLAAQRTITVAEDLLEIVQQGLTAAQELQKAGQVPETDVLQARLELNAVQIILRTARKQEAGARRELAALLGIPELPPGPLGGELDKAMPEVEYEQEWHRIASQSPALQFVKAQVQQAKTQLQREFVQPIPDIQLQGNALNDYSQNRPVYGLQVGLMLPIFNRNQGNISAAQAALHQAVENVQRLELTLRQQLAQAVQRYEVAQTQVQLFRDEILPTAQEALQLTTQGYRAGEVSFLRVLTVRRTYVENQISYINALQELQSAYVDIEGLLIVGGLNAPSQVFGQFGSGRGQTGGGASPQQLTVIPRTSIE